MSHFPVTSSILSKTHLNNFLVEQYNLPQDSQTSLLKAGVNHTYLVKSGDANLVFRLYSLDWRTLTDINEEIRLLDYLNDSGITVSHALKDDKGDYIQQLQAPEGLRYGVMFTYVDGEKLHNSPEEMHYKIGALIGQMHIVTKNLKIDRVTYTPKVLLEDPLEALKQYLQPGNELDFMQSAQKHLLQEIENADVEDIRTGVVHLDIWFDNIAISKEGAISIFDFDFCGNGWLCLDVAYYVLQLHSLERDQEVCDSKVKNFLEGYESVTPLSAEEKRLLPHLGVALYFFYLGVQSNRFDNWSNTFFNEAYVKRFVTVLVKRYYDMYLLTETTPN